MGLARVTRRVDQEFRLVGPEPIPQHSDVCVIELRPAKAPGRNAITREQGLLNVTDETRTAEQVDHVFC